MDDKLKETLVEALQQALAEPGEVRLYRSGKLPGLFAGRSGGNGEAAQHALQAGLLEVVRAEIKGKTTTDWVKLSPRGVEFLHENQSPLRLLEELRDILSLTNEGMPGWLAQILQDMRSSATRVSEDVQRMMQRLEALGQRVEEALRRADLGRLQVPQGATDIVLWAGEALAYLDRRRDTVKQGDCPLPELFAALHPTHADLSLPGFLDGLRRLHERRALRLLPFTGAPNDLPEPEYALLEGADLLYYVTR